MTEIMMKNGATFEDTWPRYPFAPLVALALALAGKIKASEKPASQNGTGHGAGPVYQ